MCRQYLNVFIIASIAALLGLGCQRNPIIPGAVSESPSQDLERIPAQAHHSLGSYVLTIDTQNPDIEVEPLRSADWQVNVTDWPYMTGYDVQVSDGCMYIFSEIGVRIFDLY